MKLANVCLVFLVCFSTAIEQSVGKIRGGARGGSGGSWGGSSGSRSTSRSSSTSTGSSFRSGVRTISSRFTSSNGYNGANRFVSSNGIYRYGSYYGTRFGSSIRSTRPTSTS